MKNLLFKGFGILTTVCALSYVQATPEGVEKILFSKKDVKNESPASPMAEIAAAPAPAGTSPQTECVCSAKTLSKAFAQIAKKATPAVVHIRVESVADANSGGDDDVFNDEFFRRFFAPPGNQQRTPQPQISQGSGFLISEDGYLATNYHVVANAKQITIIMHDDSNSEYKASLVGGDPQTDVAILKVENPDNKKFPYLEFGCLLPIL